MAGDWIKMRGSLCTHPKVLLIAEIIGEDATAGKKLTTGYNGALCDVVTSDVTRDITVAGLLRVWCATNEHTSDGVWENTTLKYLDQVSGIHGFGEALELAGWAEYDEESNSVTLPNFLEYNAPAKNGGRSSGAKRQADYRARQKEKNAKSNAISDGNGDVTSYVTVTPREEKRREDIKEPPLSPKGGKAKRGCQVPFDAIPAEYVTEAKRLRPELESLTITTLGEQFVDYHRQKGTVGKDWLAGWRTWLRNDKGFSRAKTPSHAQDPYA